jgi:hypothetical protein
LQGASSKRKDGVSILLAFYSRLDRKLEAYATETPTRSFSFDEAPGRISPLLAHAICQALVQR